ncbi:MAG: type 1 glutamine amidotransferase [Rhodocyclales bacterium GT-UBC]|nr:MAG: type 1 glutamine amidotransferase [Rhodocyclales bacterium GT-UBC]
MLPVAIFRHSPTEGPGYFAIFLEQQGIPWTLIAVDEGAPIPEMASAYSGLCFMGGPMSVNDPLPWIEPVCQLIRNAVDHDIPVIGHCLGGQLLSKALGGNVTANPVREIGWSEVVGEDHPRALQWLGKFAGKPGTVFQWHGETFTLPAGASRLMSNMHCANQIFVCGPHLGMQCHVEMTPEMIATWCQQWQEEAAAFKTDPSVQTPETMLGEIDDRLPTMRALSEQLYSVWIQGLKDPHRP